MRRTTRQVLWLGVVLAWLVPSTVGAVSIRDLVELSRAGLSDEILLAVLEADPTIFDLDADTIIEIRAAGLSERVIAAMLRSGRHDGSRLGVSDGASPVAAEVSSPYATQPGVVVIGGRPEPPPAPRVMYVPVPVFGFTSYFLPHGRSVGTTVGTSGTLNAQRGFGRFMNDGFRTGVVQPGSQPDAEPVYWGWNGRRRPGSWGEAPGR